MEVRFDNNLLNSQLLTTHDNSPVYSLKTSFTTFLGSRDLTLLQDSNPALSSGNVTVGAIHWRDKLIEIHGQKKKVADLKAKKGGILNKERHWKWSAERKEYVIKYTDEVWTAVTTKSDGKEKVAGTFAVPDRPHLFQKTKLPLLTLTRTALAEDEIFLLLVLIYSEAKRQEDTNSSVGNGSEGW